MIIKGNAGIYQLYNETKDIYYIGQSNNLKRRKNDHFKALKNNKHFISNLQNDYNNGNSIVFSVIAKCIDYERLLLSEEARYIKQYKDSGKQLYNKKDSYSFMVTEYILLCAIADKVCREKFNTTYKMLTLGKNPARFDYLFRMIFDDTFNAESEKMTYFDIGYYFMDNAKCDIKGGDLK